MRKHIGVVALLTLACLAVFTNRFGCLSTVHAKANDETTISEPVSVILDRSYVHEAYLFSPSWMENKAVEVYIHQLPLRYTLQMAVATVPNVRPKSFRALEEIGWEQHVRTSELVAFAVNYPDQLKRYGSLATRVNQNDDGHCARVIIKSDSKRELEHGISCALAGSNFLVVSMITTIIEE